VGREAKLWSLFPTHRGKQRTQRFAFRSQLIGSMLGAIGWCDLRGDPCRQKAFQPVAQDVRRNALGRGSEILEAGFAQDQVADDQKRPAVTKNIQTARERAGGAPLDLSG
jgi:hypothetical protein